MLKKQIANTHLILVGLIIGLILFSVPMMMLLVITLTVGFNVEGINDWFWGVYFPIVMLFIVTFGVGIFLCFWGESISRRRGIIYTNYHEFLQRKGHCMNCNNIVQPAKSNYKCSYCGFEFKLI